MREGPGKEATKGWTQRLIISLTMTGSIQHEPCSFPIVPWRSAVFLTFHMRKQVVSSTARTSTWSAWIQGLSTEQGNQGDQDPRMFSWTPWSLHNLPLLTTSHWHPSLHGRSGWWWGTPHEERRANWNQMCTDGKLGRDILSGVTLSSGPELVCFPKNINSVRAKIFMAHSL